MRDIFIGHYPPTPEQYDILRDEAVIILDTNALLDFYRLPAVARDDLFTVLEEVSDRLWIPYQVALEFERNRLTVIDNGRAATESVIQSMEALTKQIQEQVDKLQIDKRGLGIDVETLVAGLKKASEELNDTLRIVHDAQVDISAADPIRDRIQKLFAGKIGASPVDQDALDLLTVDGEHRFSHQLPPGYADAEKGKDPKGAEFIHRGLTYQKKFGDLIIWRQIINYIRSIGAESAMFVTSDRKPDWWQIFKGRVLGPQPELIYEITQNTPAKLFWMYTLDNFVKNSRVLSNTDTSDLTIEHIRSVSEPGLGPDPIFPQSQMEKYFQNEWNETEWHPRGKSSSIESAIKEWLGYNRGEVLPYYERFPDFLVNQNGRVVGYEVKRLSHTVVDDWPDLIQKIIKAETPIYRRAPISALSIVFVVPIDAIYSLTGAGSLNLKRQVDHALSISPAEEVIVGYMDVDGFSVWTEATKPY